MNGRLLLQDIAACIGFYTRLPVAAAPDTGRRFAETQWAAPVAGALVGLVGGVAAWITGLFGLPLAVAAAIAIGAMMLATGCLHEDGLADVADGFGGGRNKGQKLAIMRDSRIGTYGVAALVVVMLAKWTALAAIPTIGALVAALVASHAASRALLPAFMHRVAHAREDGLSAGVGRVDAGTALAALALGFVLVVLFVGIGAAILSALLLFMWFAFLQRLCERQIGGQTGDVLGTLQQGGEVIVLLVACSWFT